LSWEPDPTAHDVIRLQPTTNDPITPSNIKRRLAAIAFADVAGFSRLIAANDVETLRRWRALRTEILEPHMTRHGGRVAEMAGDAVLIEFPSVVNAVQWAVDVQRLQKTRQDEPDPFALQLRIGINVEDVIDDDGVLQGDGVNIASRIHQVRILDRLL
jgi:adenylate cyclase